MFEADTAYLWQTPFSVDEKNFCASSPTSLSQVKFELRFNRHHDDRGIPVPVPFFFSPGQRSSAVHFSTN